MSSLVFPQVASVVRGGVGQSSRVAGGMRAWSPPGRLAVKAGGGGGFQPSTGAAALNATLSPMLRARPSRSAPNPRWRCKPSSTTTLTRPRAPWPGPPDGPALVPVRRSERARCPKRRRSARTPCSATPKAHRKHSENTPKTPDHRLVSWRHPRQRGCNPLRFGQIRPNKHGPHESKSREFLLSHNRRPTLHHRPVDRELRPRGRIEVH